MTFANPLDGNVLGFCPLSAATSLGDLFGDRVVKGFVKMDVRLLIVAGLLLLTVGLAVAFAHSALAIRREHKERFRRVQQQLERDAAALVDRILRRHR